MSFHDLPDDWPRRPLRDPRLVADVLDLVVSEADRRAGAVTVLLCDTEGRLLQPVVVDDPDPDATAEDRVQVFQVFVEAMGGTGALLVAIARHDGLSITAGDRAWARAAREACGTQVDLLGVHVVTLAGSREMPAADAAA